jgi:hypothetical protein
MVNQINEMLCYSGNLHIDTKLKLLYYFCGSLYRELWGLLTCDTECIAVAWHKALKRIWGLPRSHSVIVQSLCDKWPMEEEIRKESSLFVSRCCSRDSSLVSFVSNFNIKYGRMYSALS